MRVPIALTGLLVAGAIASPVQLAFGDFYSESSASVSGLFNKVKHALPGGRPRGPHVIDLSKYTIGQILAYTLKHAHDEERRTLPIHKLAYAVNKSEIAKEIYSDESLSLTLFAPNDRGLPDRRHHGHGHEHHEAAHPFAMVAEDDGDDDEERHKKIVKIIEILLMYHTLPEAYSGPELADKSTVGTTLNTTKHGKVPFRLSLTPKLLPKPSLLVNLYSSTEVEIVAKNGRIFVVSAPLIPPPSPVATALLFPGLFSSLTNGVQLAELDRELLPGLHKYAADDEDVASHSISDIVKDLVAEIMQDQAHAAGGAGVTPVPEFTVLAPTNLAFLKLGFKVNAFLGSPFGRKALKAVLAYHVLPGVTLHSDYLHNSTVKIQHDATEEIGVDYPFSLEDDVDAMKHIEQAEMAGLIPAGLRSPVDGAGAHFTKANVTHLHHVKTALPDHTVDIDVVSYRIFGKGPIRRRVIIKPIHGRPVPVTIPDLVARSGAIHVISSVLDPRKHPHEHEHHHHDDAAAAAAFAPIF